MLSKRQTYGYGFERSPVAQPRGSSTAFNVNPKLVFMLE